MLLQKSISFGALEQFVMSVWDGFQILNILLKQDDSS